MSGSQSAQLAGALVQNLQACVFRSCTPARATGSPGAWVKCGLSKESRWLASFDNSYFSTAKFNSPDQRCLLPLSHCRQTS